jgi:hypothetical protein
LISCFVAKFDSVDRYVFSCEKHKEMATKKCEEKFKKRLLIQLCNLRCVLPGFYLLVCAFVKWIFLCTNNICEYSSFVKQQHERLIYSSSYTRTNENTIWSRYFKGNNNESKMQILLFRHACQYTSNETL